MSTGPSGQPLANAARIRRRFVRSCVSENTKIGDPNRSTRSAASSSSMKSRPSRIDRASGSDAATPTRARVLDTDMVPPSAPGARIMPCLTEPCLSGSRSGRDLGVGEDAAFVASTIAGR